LDPLRRLAAEGVERDRLDQFLLESAVLVPRAHAALRDGDLDAFAAATTLSQQLAETHLRNQVPRPSSWRAAPPSSVPARPPPSARASVGASGRWSPRPTRTASPRSGGSATSARTGRRRRRPPWSPGRERRADGWSRPAPEARRTAARRRAAARRAGTAKICALRTDPRRRTSRQRGKTVLA